jgi:Ner family transcriptional regulator
LHKADIKAAIEKAGTTLKALSLEGGLSESACRKALAVPSPRAEALIAARLNLPLHKIWPERYDERGGRRFTKVNCKPESGMSHRQIGEAA